MLDLLLIAPGNHKAIFQSLADADLPAHEPPVWAGLIANFARKKNYSVQIIDQSALNLSPDQVADQVEQLQPKLVGMIVYGHQPSASTQCMSMAYTLTDEISRRCPETPQVYVGGHPSALPQETMAELHHGIEKLEQTDTFWRPLFVCQGEGPATIEGLLNLNDFNNTRPLKKIPGLWFKNSEGGFEFSGPAPVIPQDRLPDELPGVAWDLLPMDKYRAHNWHAFSNNHQRRPYASLYTSLGCPFRCSFCCINAPFGRPSIRYWNPQFVITELDKLATDYNVVNLKIVDEMFVLHEKHVLQLCDLIIERGYNFNIWAYARIDTVKPKFLEKLKRAGFNWLVLGIESGSKHVRSGVQKGRFELGDIKTAVKRVQDHGINVHGNYIFGLPDDDYNSMNETLDLALELKTEFANFYSAMAYPGSQLFTEARKAGWALPEKWEDYSQHSYKTLPLPTEHVSAGQVLSFRDQAWQKYFTSSGYHRLLKDKFGDEAVDHIQGLTQHTLKRKFAENL